MSMISILIEELKEIGNELRNDRELDCDISMFRDDWYEVIKDAETTIRGLSAKLTAANMERSSQHYNGGWIPVNEQTPTEPGKYYIVSAVEGKRQHVTFAKWQVKLKKFDMTGARAYWKAIAWQPLPEPYKPEESENA